MSSPRPTAAWPHTSVAAQGQADARMHRSPWRGCALRRADTDQIALHIGRAALFIKCPHSGMPKLDWTDRDGRKAEVIKSEFIQMAVSTATACHRA